MTALKQLLFLALLLAPGAALAAPATMLLVVFSAQTNQVTTIQFPSLADCDATADHLAKNRSPRESTLGVPGAWKSNFRLGGMFTSSVQGEPGLLTVCIPATGDIPGVAEVLTQKGWYKDPYK